MLDDEGHGRGDHRRRAQRRAPASSRSSCCWPTRPWPQHLDEHDVPTLYRIHEAPDPMKVEEFEEFVATLGYSLGGAGERVQAAALPEAGRADAAARRRRSPIAFLMLRTMQKARYDPSEPRPLRPGGRELHALHVADPALPGPGRAPPLRESRRGR